MKTNEKQISEAFSEVFGVTTGRLDKSIVAVIKDWLDNYSKPCFSSKTIVDYVPDYTLYSCVPVDQDNIGTINVKQH